MRILYGFHQDVRINKSDGMDGVRESGFSFEKDQCPQQENLHNQQS